MRGKTWMWAAAFALAIAAPNANAHGKKKGQQQSQTQMQQGQGGAGQAGQMAMVKPDELQWGQMPPGLPQQGAQFAVVAGNPMKAGHFTARLQAQQDNFTIKPHWHSMDERITVIKGTFHAGIGDRIDKSQAKEFPEGSYVEMPAKMAHWAWADKGTIVQIEGRGPFDIHYVNPADDPRRQGVGGAGGAGQGMQSGQSSQSSSSQSNQGQAPEGQAPMGQQSAPPPTK